MIDNDWPYIKNIHTIPIKRPEIEIDETLIWYELNINKEE